MAIFPFFREISFAAFLISGILGSVNYYKSGNLDLKTAGVLSAGSFVGALAGVKINLLIPADTMKIILYLIVLLSGISILLRKDKPGNTEKKAVQSVPFYLVLGAVTGAVCAASGAGGPVLVMPILTLLGIPAYTAVGISLFDSIFSAVPSAAGYLIAAAGNKEVFLLLPVLLVAHGIRCLCRKQKCNEKQPDAAETDRGCGFDCDRVHQTLSLIEKSALCTQTLVRSVSQLFLLTKYFLREYNIEKVKRRDTMQALSKKKTGDICTIKWMFGIPDVLDFLRSRKIKEGSTVQVIQRINGGLILGMDGKRIAMCDAAADRIQV